MSLALKVDPLLLKSKFEGSSDDEVPHWVIKLISYPPAEAPATPTTIRTKPSNENEEDDDVSITLSRSSSQKLQHLQQQGVGAHTDTNFLTLLLQDEVGGLQAFSQGEWIDVDSSSDKNSSRHDEVWHGNTHDSKSQPVLPNCKPVRRYCSLLLE